MRNSKMSDTRRPAAPVMQHRARAFDVMVALYSCVRRSVGITCRQHQHTFSSPAAYRHHTDTRAA